VKGRQLILISGHGNGRSTAMEAALAVTQILMLGCDFPVLLIEAYSKNSTERKM
jgi:hypothetical protein